MPSTQNLPRATTDIERAKKDIDEFGYCQIAGALEPTLVEAARARLIEQAAAELEQGAAFEDGGPKQQWGAFTDGRGRLRQRAYTAAAGGVNQRVWMGASQDGGEFLATSGELHWDAQPATLDNPKSGLHPDARVRFKMGG